MPSASFASNEVLVNQVTTGSQSAPTAALLSNGNYVIAFTGDPQNVIARILDSNGAPIGADIPISGGNGSVASLAALPGGGFVVGWNANSDISAQVFDNDGVPAGPAFTMNTTTEGSQTTVDIAVLADGRFAATWTEFVPSVGFNAVKARLFAADGTPLGGEFQVDPVGSSGSTPSIAALTGGGFAVAWHDFEGSTSRNVYVQIFDEDGDEVGSALPVAFDGDGFQYDPVIAALPEDAFVVTWKNASAPGAPTNIIQVDAQVFDADGTPRSEVFTANADPTIFDPQGLTVQGFGDDRFLIVWPDYSGTMGDTDDGAIVGQMYDLSGTPIATAFRINTQTQNSQFDPAITAVSNGIFLAAWTDQGVSLGVDVKARLLELSLPQLFDGTDNVVNFNAIDTADYSAPFNNASGGNDTVTLPDSAGDVTALGMAGGFFGGAGSDILTRGAAFVPLIGGEGDDVLNGGGGNDVLAGDAGNDTLAGGSGANQLIGGTGDDTFIVSAAGDSIVENAGEGIDTVRTALSSYTLREHVEDLVYTGSASFAGAGNAAANRLTGGTVAASTLVGGAGNDTYVVSVGGDTLVETGGGGTDTVETGLGIYVLRAANVEDLTGTSNAGQQLRGNDLANVIAGGTGIDTMVGLLGDDTYVVRNSGDTIVEAAGQGTDTVETALGLYVLNATNVENLTYTGTGSFTGVGNALDNVITGGGASDDYLYAGAGADTLIGGAGNDVFLFNEAVAGVDTLADFTPGSDRIFINDDAFPRTPVVSLAQGSNPAPANSNSTLLYDSDTGELAFDADGDGSGAAVLFAILPSGLTLTVADFVFY